MKRYRSLSPENTLPRKRLKFVDNNAIESTYINNLSSKSNEELSGAAPPHYTGHENYKNQVDLNLKIHLDYLPKANTVSVDFLEIEIVDKTKGSIGK